MRTAKRVLVAAATGLLLLSSQTGHAQAVSDSKSDPANLSVPAQAGGGWARGSAYGRMYNPATVQSVQGKVIRVDQISPMGRMSPGVHLTVQTDSGPMSVHLGPAWYLENQETRIAQGDQIQVTGSKVDFQGKPALIAAEVRKGDEVLHLRDSSGVPQWSGWRRGMSTTQPAVTGMQTGADQTAAGERQTAGPAAAAIAGAASDDPSALLARRDELKLSQEQVRKLESIQADARARAHAVLNPQQSQMLKSNSD